jgi:hypothetical protein
MSDPGLTSADIAYIRANYFTLDELCVGRRESADEVDELIEQGMLPAPSYVFDDQTAMFPADYFVLVDQAGGIENLRAHFELRHHGAGGAVAELESDWRGYIEGVYGVCLRYVLPETIVRKGELVDSLSQLLAEPQPDDRRWRARVRRAVCELDVLEREFAPDYDRGARFERPPTRDLLISATRKRYAELFAQEALAC